MDLNVMYCVTLLRWRVCVSGLGTVFSVSSLRCYAISAQTFQIESVRSCQSVEGLQGTQRPNKYLLIPDTNKPFLSSDTLQTQQDAWARFWGAQCEFWWVWVFPPCGNLINKRLFTDDLWLLLRMIRLEDWSCLYWDYDHTWRSPRFVCQNTSFSRERREKWSDLTDVNGQVHTKAWHVVADQFVRYLKDCW